MIAGLMLALSATAEEKEMTATVRREGGKVWVEGVPGGKFGIQWDLFINAAEKLFEFRGVKADVGELLAYSGDAFNLCHASRWQGVAYLCIPTDPMANLAEAYGFEYATTHLGNTWPVRNRMTPEQRQQLLHENLARVQAEIEAGRPVLVAGAEEHCGSCSLIVGIDRANLKLCHVGDREPYRWTPIRGIAPGAPQEEFGVLDGRCRGTVTQGFVGGWQANPLHVFGERKEVPGDRVQAALRRAVALHRAPKSHRGNWGGVDYYFGAEAYRQWAADLRALDYPADTEKPQPKDAYDWYNMGNMDTQVDQIVRGRAAAAGFCERAGIPAAAQLYRDEVAIARETFGVFLPPWDGNDAPRVAWLSDGAKCEAGAAAIERMLEKEAAAVAAIEQALAP